MHTEFRRAEIPREVRALVAFDHKAFPRSDWFTPSMWRDYESWWLLIDGRRAGCCAFQPHADIDDSPLRGSLHIVSTALAPRFRRMGLGTVFKAWQLAYARRNGFSRLVTCSRRSNRAMIELNQKFGFTKIGMLRRYYRDPVESAVVMERRFS